MIIKDNGAYEKKKIWGAGFHLIFAFKMCAVSNPNITGNKQED